MMFVAFSQCGYVIWLFKLRYKVILCNFLVFIPRTWCFKVKAPKNGITVYHEVPPRPGLEVFLYFDDVVQSDPQRWEFGETGWFLFAWISQLRDFYGKTFLSGTGTIEN